MTPLDRVLKLIALTSSPHEEEARTAAVQACRMIRERGMEVREKATRATAGGVTVKVEASRDGRVWTDAPSRMWATPDSDFFEMLRNETREETARRYQRMWNDMRNRAAESQAERTPSLFSVWTYSDFPGYCFPFIGVQRLGCGQAFQPKTWRLVYHEKTANGPEAGNLCAACGEKVKPLGKKEKEA